MANYRFNSDDLVLSSKEGERFRELVHETFRDMSRAFNFHREQMVINLGGPEALGGPVALQEHRTRHGNEQSTTFRNAAGKMLGRVTLVHKGERFQFISYVGDDEGSR